MNIFYKYFICCCFLYYEYLFQKSWIFRKVPDRKCKVKLFLLEFLGSSISCLYFIGIVSYLEQFGTRRSEVHFLNFAVLNIQCLVCTVPFYRVRTFVYSTRAPVPTLVVQVQCGKYICRWILMKRLHFISISNLGNDWLLQLELVPKIILTHNWHWVSNLGQIL